MPQVLVVAQCQDIKKWEKTFVTHGDLFRSMGATKSVHYGFADGNWAAVLMETKDLALFQRIMGSQATADAMATDGVLRPTAKMFVLEKELAL
jgi:hypothetical protein